MTLSDLTTVLVILAVGLVATISTRHARSDTPPPPHSWTTTLIDNGPDRIENDEVVCYISSANRVSAGLSCKWKEAK